MKKLFRTSFLLLAAFQLALPALSHAFVYAGWLPFWKKQSGAQDVALSLEKLGEVSPFSYEVNSRGVLVDDLKIHEGFWPEWLSAVHDMGIKIIPTIAWFDGDQIHAILSKKSSRIAQENAIAKLVKMEKWSGIDIDYEDKMAKTKPYFSLFIQGLAERLHSGGKLLSCTVEARTPPASLYHTMPDTIQYSNDYTVLNHYCDEVRIMTYDQGAIDLTLNDAKGNGSFYVPVSDADWAKKVIKETIKTISRKKIMLGVPTYGYEYQVSWADGVTTYRRVRSRTYLQAMTLAESVGATPIRNSASELSFTYATTTYREVSAILRSDVSSTFPTMLTQIVNAATAATTTRLMWFPDAESAGGEIALAKTYGLRGVVFFKFDGEQDPLIWGKMK